MPLKRVYAFVSIDTEVRGGLSSFSTKIYAFRILICASNYDLDVIAISTSYT